MNPYITTKKQKQPNKNNRNHYIRWVMVTILFILIALFFTGCSERVNNETPIYNISNLKVNNESILNVEYKYDVQMPQIDVIASDSDFTQSDTQKIYNVTLKLSDLGLSSTKTITLTTILEKE
tara:strand:+ start:92 stop:460 length:369 start_codon:yes stop_codon:yes gene_type:complete